MSYDLLADWPRLVEAFDKAPSVFNTKPWSFTPVPPDHIELRLPGLREMRKALGRESVISCGAALYNLRLAIRVAGHDLEVLPMPEPHDPELLASVEVVIERTKNTAPREQGLYEAIGHRHTNRWPYTIVPAPLPIIAAMEEAAFHEGAQLRLLDSSQARKWMRLCAEVDTAKPGTTGRHSRDVRHKNRDRRRHKLSPGAEGDGPDAGDRSCNGGCSSPGK